VWLRAVRNKELDLKDREIEVEGLRATLQVWGK
jgi:hypothetical protein